MKSKNKLINIIGILTFVMITYCIFAYIYIKKNLTIVMLTPTKEVIVLGNIIVLALFFIGIYHLILLINALKTLTYKSKNILIHSLYIVFIILSGITLLSDLTLLSDIGKEYLLWDVTSQWYMLYGFTLFHMFVVIYGFIYLKKNPSDNIKLFREFESGNDIMFLSMHYIAFISGLMGIFGIILTMTGIIVPERFNLQFMIFIAGLVLFPLVLIVTYWIIKMRNKSLREWFDEKQISDTSYGTFLSLLIIIPVYLMICIVDFYKFIILPITFWILLIFFVQLVVYSMVIMVRNKNLII